MHTFCDHRKMPTDMGTDTAMHTHTRNMRTKSMHTQSPPLVAPTHSLYTSFRYSDIHDAYSLPRQTIVLKRMPPNPP